MVKKILDEQETVFCDDCQTELKATEAITIGHDNICKPCVLLDIEPPTDYFVDVAMKEDVNEWKH